MTWLFAPNCDWLDTGIWADVEFPTLKANKDITQVIWVDSTSLVETTIWPEQSNKLKRAAAAVRPPCDADSDLPPGVTVPQAQGPVPVPQVTPAGTPTGTTAGATAKPTPAAAVTCTHDADPQNTCAAVAGSKGWCNCSDGKSYTIMWTGSPCAYTATPTATASFDCAATPPTGKSSSRASSSTGKPTSGSSSSSSNVAQLSRNSAHVGELTGNDLFTDMWNALVPQCPASSTFCNPAQVTIPNVGTVVGTVNTEGEILLNIQENQDSSIA
ncbi:hypothetical protein OEA41_009152 [Lepraria neglecta]|uniref:Uncharacterized protein n=1 Tax=Lepraria neglecta TaxID=209136 RepID=A0AAE0DJY4_9LECA|nr:hypothetical protein OEA41_009152 [Lepraria neglecta]